MNIEIICINLSMKGYSIMLKFDVSNEENSMGGVFK